jgi:hypothetical protein
VAVARNGASNVKPIFLGFSEIINVSGATGISAGISLLRLSSQSIDAFIINRPVSGPTNFGSGTGDIIPASDATGDVMGVAALSIITPRGYVSGTELSATAT